MWRYRVILVPLLTLIPAGSTEKTGQHRDGGLLEPHSDSLGAPPVLLTAVSDGVENAFAETQGELNLSSKTLQQDIRPYNSSGVPLCHECFLQGAGACGVCIHGEHESNGTDNVDEVFAALEKNHYAVKNLNKTFYMKRGEGPFGSLGNRPPTRQAPTSFLESQSKTDTIDLELGLAETSVPIVQLKDSQYCGMLGIGTPPQWVHPIFDTGSTNLWVVGSKCTDDTCTKVTQFDPEKSETFKYTQPQVHLDITFGTGRIGGTTGIDNFQIGPFTVKDQTFGLVESESGHNMHGNIFKSIDFEGIVGMGFPEMSSTGATPIYDNIMNQANLKRNEFAFYVAKNSPVSALFFGGVDPRFYEPPIHMFPVEREHYWEVALDSIFVGDKKFCCKEGTKNYVILDSGTSFNTMPGEEMRSFLEAIPSQALQGCGEGGSISRVAVKQTPLLMLASTKEGRYCWSPLGVMKLGFACFQSGVHFVLKPEDYLAIRRKHPLFGVLAGRLRLPCLLILDEVGIARAVHSDQNQQYLRRVMDEYQAGTRKGSDILAVERSTGSFRSLLVQEDVALRDSNKAVI